MTTENVFTRLRTLMHREGELVVLWAVVLITAIGLGAVLSPTFFATGNLQSMAIQVSAFGFLSLGMGIAMLSGGIDLSVVSAAILAGVAGATVISGEIIPVTESNGALLTALAAVVCVVVGLLCGLLNGILIAKVSIPPILATLSTMILFSGIGMAVTDGQSVSVATRELSRFANSTVVGVPVMFVLLAVALLLMGFVLSRRRFGRRLYLFGENQVALRFAGGRTERTIIFSYAIIGVLVGLAGLILLARVNSMRVGFGESYLLQAILVVVLAGFNPYGGRGRVGMLAVALLLLQFVSSALNAVQSSPYLVNLVWGGMLLVVMVANYYMRRVRPFRARAAAAPPGGDPVDGAQTEKAAAS